MQFSEVVGQSSVKEKLIQTVKDKRVSHAQMFLGKEGSGNLALAIAYAQYIACTNKDESDSCGKCGSCIKFQKLVHPDLHFAFPVATNKRVTSKPTSKDYIVEWRESILQNPYINLFEWLQKLEVENKQGLISVYEGADILKILSYKSFESEYKILIIWMPEKMNSETSNMLLKQIEEPESKTLFLLVAEDEDKLISTIKSRTQLVRVPAVDMDSINSYLLNKHQLNAEEASRITLMCSGNVNEAIKHVGNKDYIEEYFEQFKIWMRVSWKADIEGIYNWVEEISAKNVGREKQKGFLAYALSIVRESIVVNYGRPEISQLQKEEKEFVQNFSPFVHGKNVLEMVDIINTAHYHIERNANPKILFMDLSMKFANLLHVKM